MKPSGKLRAWLEDYPGNKVLAAFVGVSTLPDGDTAVADRKPAVKVCSSSDNARQWIESEAMAFGLPVEWVDAGALVRHT